jgi:hypothetical protein
MLQCRCAIMPRDQFADVARQLEELLSDLNHGSDPALRRRMLAHMRLLIVEADRLAARKPQVKRSDRFVK